MKLPCLFVPDIRKAERFRPCAKCRANRKKVFGGECWETKSRFEWWAAENRRLQTAISFRCFPNSDHLPRTPSARLKYLLTEYENAMTADAATIRHRYRDRPHVGVVWERAGTNNLFSKLLTMAEGARTRPAYPCEVANWLSGHRDDFLAMRDQEALIRDLESYV